MQLLFFSISGGELIIILLGIYLVLGPKKLPEISKKIGKIFFEVKKATNEIQNELNEGAGTEKDPQKESLKFEDNQDFAG